MSTIILIVIVFAIIFYIKMSKLVKLKYWKELIIFSALWLFTCVLVIIYSQGIKLPNPNEPVEILLKFTSK